MLVSRYPQSLARAVYFDERQVNQGAVFENVVAQQLVAAGYPLYYSMSRKRGEVDFLTEGRAGEVVPLEVKSGAVSYTHLSPPSETRGDRHHRVSEGGLDAGFHRRRHQHRHSAGEAGRTPRRG